MNSIFENQTKALAQKAMAFRQLDLDQEQVLSYLKMGMVKDLKPNGSEIIIIHVDEKTGSLVNDAGQARDFFNREYALFACEEILK